MWPFKKKTDTAEEPTVEERGYLKVKGNLCDGTPVVRVYQKKGGYLVFLHDE